MASKREGGGAAAHGAEAKARVEAWLGAVERVRPDEFVPVASFDEVSGQARADSYFFCDAVFAAGANPHLEGRAAHHAFHPAQEGTLDLLRHEYEALGYWLRVTEGRNFLLVEVLHPRLDLRPGAATRRRVEVRRVARALFQRGVDRRGLRPPVSIDEGTCFPTDPEADPLLLGHWLDRAECGVRNGVLFFLVYKKAPHRVGFLHAGQWFDDTMRGLPG